MFNKEKTELGLLIEKTVVGSFVGCRRIKKIVIHHYDYRLYTRTYFSGVSLSFSIGKLLRMKMRFNSGLKPYDFSPDTPQLQTIKILNCRTDRRLCTPDTRQSYTCFIRVRHTFCNFPFPYEKCGNEFRNGTATTGSSGFGGGQRSGWEGCGKSR